MTNAQRERTPGIAPKVSAVLLLLGGLASATCGKSPTGPSSSLTVRAISPNSGTTLGGTMVTITGTKFAADATVTIGGTAATNITVQGETSLTATTPQHASGAADVVVNAGGKTGNLAGAFTFVSPGRSDNQAPVIVSITAKDRRSHAPSQFADLDDLVDVTATVTDAETPPDQLDYQWSAPAGSFSGTGASVRWQAPHSAQTPANVDLTLTVVEHYQSTDDSGLPVTRENRTTRPITVSLHNSEKEVGDMAVLFLNDFSDQKQSPDQILRNFMQCTGRDNERNDTINNQATLTIKTHNVGSATVHINFGGTCSFRDRAGDACIDVPVDWHSIKKSDGSGQHSYGIDRLTGFYQNSRWWLCDSDFDGYDVPEPPVSSVNSTK